MELDSHRCAMLRPEVLCGPPRPSWGLVKTAGDFGVLLTRHVEPVVVLSRRRGALGPHLRQAFRDDGSQASAPVGALVLCSFGTLTEGGVGRIGRIVQLSLTVGAGLLGRVFA